MVATEIIWDVKYFFSSWMALQEKKYTVSVVRSFTKCLMDPGRHNGRKSLLF